NNLVLPAETAASQTSENGRGAMANRGGGHTQRTAQQLADRITAQRQLQRLRSEPQLRRKRPSPRLNEPELLCFGTLKFRHHRPPEKRSPLGVVGLRRLGQGEA